jgi:hypothetical protein
VSRKRKRDKKEREKFIERRRQRISAEAKKPNRRRARQQQGDRGVRSSSRRDGMRSSEASKPAEPERSRVNSLRTSVSSLMTEANGVQKRISDLDDNIGDLTNRISKIRRGNYFLMGYIEEAQGSLADRWGERGPALRDEVWVRLDSTRSDLQSLSGIVSSLDSDASPGVSDAESRLRRLRGDVSSVRSLVMDEVNEIEGSFSELDSELALAENTVELLSEPSFEWKMKEHPVISIRAHHLDEDVHGVLTLTNQRFIFEGEKEVVLKKMLFIATEKKTVRETIIDEPVGAVETIEKGKVGFFKGAGLYVKFNPQTSLKEARFDTRGIEGDQVVRLFEYIDSGEAERELKKVRGEEEEEGASVPVVCPICSAPYTEEIFRGQTSLECIYCGTAIHLES